jgi:hypothetical protein
LLHSTILLRELLDDDVCSALAEELAISTLRKPAQNATTDVIFSSSTRRGALPRLCATGGNNQSGARQDVRGEDFTLHHVSVAV